MSQKTFTLQLVIYDAHNGFMASRDEIIAPVTLGSQINTSDCDIGLILYQAMRELHDAPLQIWSFCRLVSNYQMVSFYKLKHFLHVIILFIQQINAIVLLFVWLVGEFFVRHHLNIPDCCVKIMRRALALLLFKYINNIPNVSQDLNTFQYSLMKTYISLCVMYSLYVIFRVPKNMPTSYNN